MGSHDDLVVAVRGFKCTPHCGNCASLIGFDNHAISESSRGLVLTFCFSVTFPDVEPGSRDEQERGVRMSKSYMQAVETTLAESRRRAAANAL